MDWDVVIIGSGVGGGCVASSLADTGARILILERGERLPREPQNWDPEAVFVENRYRTTETWYDGTGNAFRPGQFYYVGGHTKVYGTAMFRFRERDFDGVEHAEGTTVPWPIRYAELEPWYAQAERVFGVHGKAGDDPTEPARSGPFPHPPIPHEPVIGEIFERMQARGLHPSHMPAAIDFHPGGTCIRCGTCDAFPCKIGAKGDAETRLIDPALKHANVQLQTGSLVTRLLTDERGKRIVAVEVERGGERLTISARLFVLSAGAINSAAVLLRSADSKNPNGVANSSGMVGRYYMNHNCTAILAVTPWRVNRDALSQDPHAQRLLLRRQRQRTAAGQSATARQDRGADVARRIAQRSEVVARLARATQRRLVRDVRGPGASRQQRRRCARTAPSSSTGSAATCARTGAGSRWRRSCSRTSASRSCCPNRSAPTRPRTSAARRASAPIPPTSVLDPYCRAWDHENLYVVDASFFPSSAALNPALTVAAQALRVGAHLKSRLDQF